MRWLLFNYLAKDMSQVYSNYPNSFTTYSICKNKLNESKEIVRSVSLCNLKDVGTTLYAEFYQVSFLIEFTQGMVAYVLIPLASLVGLFFCSLITFKVYKNKTDELKDDFYKYMSLNSVFNCIYCAIFIFYPINTCVDELNDYFCSSIR